MARKVGAGSEKSQAAGCTRVVVGSFVLIIVLAVLVPLYFWLTTGPPSSGGPCSIDLSVPIEGSPLPNGSIVDRGDVYPSGFFFTVNRTTRGCLCALQPCIRKCCAADEYIVSAINKTSHCAVNSGSSPFDNFSIPVYDSDQKVVQVKKNHFRILYGDVCTYGKFVLTSDDKSYLMSDGNILLESNLMDASQYCMESINGDEIQIFVCFPPGEDAQTKAAFTAYPIGMILSFPFLLGTFVVYAVIPDLHGTLHGKSLMSHVSSLLTAYISLSVVQLGRDAINSFWCVALSFVIQFSFLATFFWLNVMCFDIWWVFSGLRPLRGSVKEREHKKFILYSLYAWGCPLVIFVITLVIELVPSIPKSFIKPQFGVDKCWFKTSEALVLYFYLPIGVLVLLNIAMFVTTAFRLRMHTRDTKVLQTSESRRNDEAERQRFNLYLKLFIVMGINWVMELVSFVVGGPKSIWFVTDLGNTLQGLLIFLIFVCKRRILRLLNQKLCPRWELVAPTASSRSKVSPSRTSSSSLSKTVSSNPDGLSLKPIARAASEESDSNN
ncbi:G-protein coupled receptor Mth2-like isoform X2 [Homalodisca vitripennis]|uniref:G-protein coupled receptor Mth2-like isoform X2 n=1 Tax=Homalodisca vitripennis TaxID=197043 RepID=UPI001EEB6697|nr:G-protein coupled receptor Mth2-like isoform X2 [Homalodisca vitripennis]